MARKRTGMGGNSSRDPRSNLQAHADYQARHGRATKSCTGFLHHDGPEVPIDHFRQQKGNKSSGLQSRCDLCNRLYFSIIQKPTKRIAAVAIWATVTKAYDWKHSCPSVLHDGINRCIDWWESHPCTLKGCSYTHHHGSYRDAARALTDAWCDRDKEPRSATVVDQKSKKSYPAPAFMSALQTWAGNGGTLWKHVDTEVVWEWWCSLFPEDTATCSAERSAVANGEMEGPPPEHPLSDFSWGAGNILDTTQGHSVPGFNQVRAAVRTLLVASNIGGRVYGYLCDGNHLAMRRFSEKCKADGMSLGHFPAPLRWLGKNDPANGQAQPLLENIGLNDSLSPLYHAVERDPSLAAKVVSRQIAPLVERLARERVGVNRFTIEVQSAVENYLDSLEAELDNGNNSRLLEELRAADPGQTAAVYQYRAEKVTRWIRSRPTSKRRRQRGSSR